MNKFINALALTALMVSAVACSSKPKVEEQTTAPEIAAAPAETAPPVEVAPAKDLSLGAGSSGRGH